MINNFHRSQSGDRSELKKGGGMNPALQKLQDGALIDLLATSPPYEEIRDSVFAAIEFTSKWISSRCLA